MGADDDWRLGGQETFLQGVALVRKPYKRWSESWDHDHCAFCWAAIMEADDAAEPGATLTEGYATTAEHPRGENYYWICPRCFEDFKERFGWTVVSGSN